MGAGASKETEIQKSPPPIQSKNDINKEQSGHVIVNDQPKTTMIEQTKDTEKMPTIENNRTSEQNSNEIVVPLPSNGTNKPNLEWSNSIDSDLEQDGEDLKALQGELDQVLEGHGRILKNQHYRQQPRDVLVPQKMDWRPPDELLQQERTLLSVYKSQSLERLDGLADHAILDPRRLHTDDFLQKTPHETNGSNIKENSAPVQMQNGFDPTKFKAANTSQKAAKTDVYLETTYKDYKVEKQDSDVSFTSTPFASTLSPNRGNVLPPGDQAPSPRIKYDPSEELLMAEIEQDYDL